MNDPEPKPVPLFSCPSWCNMRDTPDKHPRVRADDPTRVHVGENAGIDLYPFSPRHVHVGYSADVMAYSLADGSPGRPFLRLRSAEEQFPFDADGDDRNSFFDLHELRDISELMAQYAGSLAHLALLQRRIIDWEAQPPSAPSRLHPDGLLPAPIGPFREHVRDAFDIPPSHGTSST
ncbi:hypothetical protein ACWGR4_33010 [Embleya sp. NPDC055664]